MCMHVHVCVHVHVRAHVHVHVLVHTVFESLSGQAAGTQQGPHGSQATEAVYGRCRSEPGLQSPPEASSKGEVEPPGSSLQ